MTAHAPQEPPLQQQRRHQRRHRRRPRPGPASAALSMLAAAAILAAACSAGAGSQPGASPVASLPGHPGGAVHAGKLTTAQSDRDMIDFTRCMRSHGVQVPDPVHRAGHTGLSIEIPTETAATRSAWNVCSHLIEPIIALKQAGAASQTGPHLAALTRYAQCMRGHDIGMLDPTSYGALNLGNVPGISSDFGRYSPQFRAADASCRHLLPAGIRDDGTGP